TAYRLDRLLGFDLVPVAVRRELDGRVGALYLDTSALPAVEALMDTEVEPWCPLDDQRQLATVFDFLVNKQAPGQRRFMESSVKRVLSDNHAILDTQTAPPPVPSLAFAPGLGDALRGLSAESLEQALGDVVDEARRLALLERRDMLLEGSP